MPARSDLELDMINYSVTMNKYTMAGLVLLLRQIRWRPLRRSLRTKESSLKEVIGCVLRCCAFTKSNILPTPIERKSSTEPDLEIRVGTEALVRDVVVIPS